MLLKDGYALSAVYVGRFIVFWYSGTEYTQEPVLQCCGSFSVVELTDIAAGAPSESSFHPPIGIYHDRDSIPQFTGFVHDTLV